MNRNIRVLVNQSLFDIAIQQCGSVEAVFDIAELNGLSITDVLNPGMLLEIPLAVVADKTIADYYRVKGLRPATGGGTTEDLLLDGIGYWAVGVDNVVM